MSKKINPLLQVAVQRLERAGLWKQGESTTIGREGHELLARDTLFRKRLLESSNLALVVELVRIGLSPYFCLSAKNRKEAALSPFGFDQGLFLTPGHAEYSYCLSFHGLGEQETDCQEEMVLASFLHGLYSTGMNYFRLIHASGLYSYENFSFCAKLYGPSFIEKFKSAINEPWLSLKPEHSLLRGNIGFAVLLWPHDRAFAEEFLRKSLDFAPREIVNKEALALYSTILDGHLVCDNHPGLLPWLMKSINLSNQEIESIIPIIFSKLTSSSELVEDLYLDLLSRTSEEFRARHSSLILNSSVGIKDRADELFVMVPVPEINESLGMEALSIFKSMNTVSKLTHAYNQHPHFVSSLLELARPQFSVKYGVAEKIEEALLAMPNLHEVPPEALGKDEISKVIGLVWDLHQGQYPHDPNRYGYPHQSVKMLNRIGSWVTDDKSAKQVGAMLPLLIDERAKEALLKEAPASLMMKHLDDNRAKKMLISRDLEV